MHDEAVQLQQGRNRQEALAPTCCDRLAPDTSTDSQRQSNDLMQDILTMSMGYRWAHEYMSVLITNVTNVHVARARMHPKPLFQRGPMSGLF